MIQRSPWPRRVTQRGSGGDSVYARLRRCLITGHWPRRPVVRWRSVRPVWAAATTDFATLSLLSNTPITTSCATTNQRDWSSPETGGRQQRNRPHLRRRYQVDQKTRVSPNLKPRETGLTCSLWDPCGTMIVSVKRHSQTTVMSQRIR